MDKFEGIITSDDLLMKYRRPEGSGPFPVLLMLHGWTGDESSMWIFAPRLLKNALLISPRGIFPNDGNGYSWYPKTSKAWPWVNDFVPAIEALLGKINSNTFPDGDFSELHIIGFSQGAALAYTMTILNPERIASLAGLSGFLPDGASTWLVKERLLGLPVFIAHGTQDELVPVEKARMSVGHFQDVGANVTYCEDEVGHKLSAKCFHGLEAFYTRLKT